jgi:3'(2'),5'-bisphosphate nucleotidase
VKPDVLTDTQLAEALIAAVAEAGRAILDVRQRGYRTEHKADATPVTEADRAAERIILERLAQVAPDVAVIAEEACAAGHLPAVGRVFFLVDALDGTKEFVKGGDDFTVNVGLVRDRAPVMGIVHTPATGDMFVGVLGEGAWATCAGTGAWSARRPIHVRAAPEGQIDVVASKSHRTPETDAYIARYAVRSLVAAGSSLKFCCIAEGRADLYPRMGTTMQWDTAAGDAVLRAAGGRTMTLNGSPLRYGPNDTVGAAGYQNPWFVAAGAVDLVF